MNANVSKSMNEQISQQELQYLITVSTGFIDAYIIECHGKKPMLLPQNIVLSAHDLQLPVYAINRPDQTEGVALVIEGDDASQRFALMCNEMPKSIRLRISEIVDDESPVNDPTIFQLVRMGDETYHVPNLNKIQASLGL